MLKALREKLQRDESGFTLIELMVVVLIIAILIAIAIPTFLGARTRAQDKAAQSNLRNGLITVDEYFTDNESYTADTATMEDLEPQLDWGNANAEEAGLEVFVPAGDNTSVILRSESASGTVFCLGKVATDANGGSPGTYYTKACDGTEDSATVSGWNTTTAGWK